MLSSSNSRVLIFGASGQFGRRLCGRLVQVEGKHLLLGGRDRRKLLAMQTELAANKPAANIDIVACDINSHDIVHLLHSRGVDLVVHLAGPFQMQDYRVAKACLQAGVPYIDMADGREFVEKFISLDDAAREKGGTLITGASTVPGLSSAIIDATLSNFAEMQAVNYGICAGLKTGLGPATLQAVLSYCGKPYEVLRDGRPATIYGLGRPRSHGFAKPVNRRFIVDCDIPDHALFPARYPTLKQMNFGSGIDVPGLSSCLSLMSESVRRGWIADLAFLSHFIQPFMKAVRPFGSANSGFFMKLSGLDAQGKPKRLLFEILARDGSGLEIPVTPVILLIKKMLKAGSLPAGAYPCMGLFSLAEFQQELLSFPISWEWKSMQ